MNKEKLIERVRKLYAMSQDASSPNEAAIAAKRARKLMDESGITVADLQQSEFAKQQASEHSFRKMPTWYNVLTVGVGKYNDCNTGRIGGIVQFKGFEQDVIGAQLMLEYLISAMERQLKEHKPAGRKESNSFRVGFCSDMQRRLKDLHAERTQQQQEAAQASGGQALMVVKQDLVAQEFGVQRYSKSRAVIGDRDSYYAGRAASQRTGLNSQVGTSAAPQARIS